jgi:hypothetical protein
MKKRNSNVGEETIKDDGDIVHMGDVTKEES